MERAIFLFGVLLLVLEIASMRVLGHADQE